MSANWISSGSIYGPLIFPMTGRSVILVTLVHGSPENRPPMLSGELNSRSVPGNEKASREDRFPGT